MSVTATHRYQLDLAQGARLVLVEPLPYPDRHEQSSADRTYCLSLHGPLLGAADPKVLTVDVSQAELRELVKLLDCAVATHESLLSRLLP